MAISFAYDGFDVAESCRQICEYHNLRCYLYTEYIAEQAGLDIYSIMDFVFTTSRATLILNTLLYNQTKMSSYELAVVSGDASQMRVVIANMGGSCLPAFSNVVSVIDGFATTSLVDAITRAVGTPIQPA